VVYSLFATTECGVLVFGLFWLRKRLRKRVDAKLGHTKQIISTQGAGVRLGHYLGQPLLVISRIAFWLILLAVLQAYGTVVLRLFPSTKCTSYQVTNWLFSQLAGFGKNVIAYFEFHPTGIHLPDYLLIYSK
jgi:hypothetical protein